MKTVGQITLSRRRLLGGALVAAFVPLVGCNDASSSRTNADPNAPVSVRVAFFPNITHAAALYGTGTGTFQKAFGETATIKEVVFTAGPSEIEALFASEVDLGYIGPGPALNGYLKSKGDALQIVAGAASGGVSLVSRADVSIKTIADLAGKTVAAPQKGGTQDLSLRHAISEAGLKPKEKGGNVTVVDFAPADILTQFQRKTIDAAWIPEPWVTRLEKEVGAKIVADERTLWKTGTFSTAVVIVRSAFLKEHPELVATFVAAHKAVVAEIAANPEEARKVIGERIKTLNSGKAIPDDVLKTALERTEITADPLQESVLTFADWSREAGYIREDRSALSGLFADIPAPKGDTGGAK
ncbi:MAG: ABC transporter substrate-binding protein [Armatimonadetes bacterium]|nr:ABC transporter substrate-binding protein [Armatimonadota bacterium]